MPQPDMQASPNDLLTSLLTSLSDFETPAESSILDKAANSSDPSRSVLTSLAPAEQSRAKNVLLTLHFLFPHELLPALDLLDRKLITCLTWLSRPNSFNDAGMLEPGNEEKNVIYYVQSASAASASASSTKSASLTANTGRNRNVYASFAQYEVSLDSWNCSCPAFAFSTMKLLMTDTHISAEGAHLKGGSESKPKNTVRLDWKIGGIATRPNSVVPICKHILAVALGNAAPSLFGDGMNIQQVDREEIAGRAAGWSER